MATDKSIMKVCYDSHLNMLIAQCQCYAHLITERFGQGSELELIQDGHIDMHINIAHHPW